MILTTLWLKEDRTLGRLFNFVVPCFHYLPNEKNSYLFHTSVMIKIIYAKSLPQSLGHSLCSPNRCGNSADIYKHASGNQDYKQQLPWGKVMSFLFLSVHEPQFTHLCNKKAAPLPEKSIGFGVRLAPKMSSGLTRPWPWAVGPWGLPSLLPPLCVPLTVRL